MMLRQGLALALFGAFACAQTATVPLFLLDTDPQTLVASVITANPSSTQYLVGCPSTVSADECGYNPPETVMNSGSIYGASLTASAEQFTMSYKCTVYTTSGTSAVCTTSAGGAQANFPGVATTTLSGTDVSFIPVTVTAGVNQLVLSTTTGAASGSAATSASSNRAPTAAVGMGLAGLAAVAMAL